MNPSVAFRTDDTENWGLPLAGPGLLLDVPGAGQWSGRPSLHVEFTSRFRLRVSSGGQPLFWFRNSGAVLPLRAPSPEDDGRVKSWRKHAREGTLPPALLLYVDIVGKWCVLDGHDRLHAALLEGVAPPLLGLWPVFEKPIPVEPFQREGMWFAAEAQLRSRNGGPEGIDRANRTLLREYAGVHRVAVTRAWPVRGGLEAWRAEVLACRRWNTFPADARAWDWFASLTE